MIWVYVMNVMKKYSQRKTNLIKLIIMPKEFKDYTIRVISISIKTPYQELIEHLLKEEKNGWNLFSIQAVIGEPYTYVVTLYKD